MRSDTPYRRLDVLFGSGKPGEWRIRIALLYLADRRIQSEPICRQLRLVPKHAGVVL